MVLVNNQKFACESCIKGHRSSACSHTERPLFEIKRKGRPVSQCEKCRDLRLSKKVHSKCSCDPVEQAAAQERARAAAQALASGVKLRVPRFKPIPPSLPNGIRDLPLIYGVVVPPMNVPHPKESSRCGCGKSRSSCKCHASSARVIEQAGDGLTTLAKAAALCCSKSAPANSSSGVKHISSRPGSPTSKRRKQDHAAVPPPGLDLPPLLFDPESSPVVPEMPSFEVMPPMSQMTSLAGTGCTCGLQCACPGCVEHRGASRVSKSRTDCGEGCNSCVDHAAEIVRTSEPGGFSSAISSGSGSSIIDQFFARAAALPAPPIHRTMGIRLDPRNTDMFDRAFESVNLPKLECCGGKCACPEGSCQCGHACDGSCGAGHAAAASRNIAAPTFAFGARPNTASPRPSVPTPAPAPRGCCAGKSSAVAPETANPLVAPPSPVVVVVAPAIVLEAPTPAPAVRSCCAGKAAPPSS